MDLSWSLYVPLVLAAVAFAGVSIAASIVSSRGNHDGAERVRDIGFLVLLAMGVWTVVLLLMAIFSEPDDIWDMVIIVLVIVVFFAILLLVFWAISLVIGAIGRGLSRRQQVTTEDL
jgi:hypothetical protein